MSASQPTQTETEGDPDATDRFDAARERFDRIDREITRQMNRFGIPALRVALGIVFFWFGGL
jgi:hypothetical protein